MTERDWQGSDDPRPMLALLDDRPLSQRRQRLWACAVALSFPQFLKNGSDHQQAVACAERFLKGQATPTDMEYWFNKVPAAPGSEYSAGDMAWLACIRNAEDGLTWVFQTQTMSMELLQPAAHFLREIVGNPFQPSGPLAPAWLAPDVLAIANATYQERQEDGMLDEVRLLILADALEESGCTDDLVLEHLRGQQRLWDDALSGWNLRPLAAPHCRGCWALDLVLGKR